MNLQMHEMDPWDAPGGGETVGLQEEQRSAFLWNEQSGRVPYHRRILHSESRAGRGRR